MLKMRNYSSLVFSRNSFVFLFSLAVIHGVSFHLMDLSTLENNPDSITYLGIAEFDFDQSEIRKYRVFIPFLAAAVNFIFGDLFDFLAPWTYEGDFSIGVSFMIVNNLFIAFSGVLVFKYIFAHTENFIASIIGLVSMLTCRWTGYLAGTPMVDSFFVLILTMVLLGLKTGNRRLLVFSIFLGPWAKESFIFIAPIIFFYAPIPKKRQILLFLTSGILVFSGRYLIDLWSSTPPLAGLEQDINHLGYILLGAKRLFSFHGIYEVFSNTGFWIVLLLPAILRRRIKGYLMEFSGFEYWYVGSVIFQALISVEIARMLYLLTPVLAVLWARISADLFQKELYIE